MPQQINLCASTLQKPQQTLDANTLVIVLAVLLVVGGAAATLWAWKLQEASAGYNAVLQTQAQEMKSLQAAIDHNRARVQPLAPALVQEAQELRAALQTQEKNLAVLQHGLLEPGRGHSDRLALLARSIPDAVWLTAVRADGVSMEISGHTLEPSALNDWVTRLAASPLLASLRLSDVQVHSTAQPGSVLAGNPQPAVTAPVVQGAQRAVAQATSVGKASTAPAAREMWSFKVVSTQPGVAAATGGAP